jgi:DNA-binding XRE family transcriptional regulator
MNKPIEFQTIVGPDGQPAFVVMPYAEFVRRFEAEGGLVPHAVAQLALEQDVPPAKAWRTHLGLTQADVAHRMGISQSAYAQIEGGSMSRKSTRERVAAALGIQPGQLDF